MSLARSLTCTNCGKTYPIKIISKICPSCKNVLTVSYDYEAARGKLTRGVIDGRAPNIWRYFELLPVKNMSSIVSLGEGGTFLHRCGRLADMLGIKSLYIKNETTNPTGSFMDRGTTVSVSGIKEGGFKSLCCVPMGNLGASLAAYSAKAGFRCVIFISHEIDLGKLYQMIAYDAEIRFTDALEDAGLRLKENGEDGFLVTPADPYFLEGKKTISLEICSQLGWGTPTRIIAPIGNGGLLSMVWKGIQEFLNIGLVRDESTMVTGIQAEGCSPIVEAFKERREIKPVEEPRTIAVDIRVGNPLLGRTALKAIRETGGTAAAVSDPEILSATRLLAKTEGVFAEPAATSTIAGLRRLIDEGEIDRDEEVVCIITGAGLKDLSTTRRLVGRRRRIRMFVDGIEGRKLKTRLGETKMRILKILSRKGCHGYGIWKELREFYMLNIRIPSVYQHLSELEALGLSKKSGLKAVAGRRRRRYYSITERGMEILRTFDKLEAQTERDNLD